MIRVTMDTRKFNLALRQLVAQTRKSCQTEVAKAAKHTVSLARRFAPKAVGTLKGRNTGIVSDLSELRSRTLAKVKVLPKYAPFVEGFYHNYQMGRGPGRWPPTEPVDPIKEWVRIKGIARKWFGIETASTLAQATFLVRRKIGTKGTPAQPFFQPAYVIAKQEFELALTDVLSQAAKQVGIILGRHG